MEDAENLTSSNSDVGMHIKCNNKFKLKFQMHLVPLSNDLLLYNVSKINLFFSLKQPNSVMAHHCFGKRTPPQFQLSDFGCWKE